MTPIGRQLRDFAIAAVLAVVIATIAFVAVRNHELAERQRGLATRAVETALADGTPNLSPLPEVEVVLVGAPVPSRKHPLLRQRSAQDKHGCRVLSAAGGPDDKLLYDAANRADRTRATATATDAATATAADAATAAATDAATATATDAATATATDGSAATSAIAGASATRGAGSVFSE
ncbi:MAG TPA: hypothetical protein VM513_20285, partial [Kofleriaceae bacterium]|nr:hypothetical protein [Kofleriaceae bacterium]